MVKWWNFIGHKKMFWHPTFTGLEGDDVVKP